MTQYFRDDVTSVDYEDDEELVSMGIHMYGGIWSLIDVHEETLQNDPEKVADELHDLVDEWLGEMEQNIKAADELDQEPIDV